MSSNQSQRPIFYEDQYLGADDLNAGIDFSRIQSAQHDLGAHTWGIAAGLAISEKPSPSGGGLVDAFILPGYAWDGFGRPIVVLTPYKIPAELFKSYVYDAGIDDGSPAGRLIMVWLAYDEAAVNAPSTGFESCSANSRFSRIQESFHLEIGDLSDSAQRDPLSVAGLSIDAQTVLQQFNPQTPALVLGDGSVPYQDFPLDDPKARWLVPLGSVRWQPNPDATKVGNFVARQAPDLVASFKQRTYAGVVAGTVYAADHVIRMRDRTVDYSKLGTSQVMSTDLVWVEGDLRIEGDVHLFNGKVDFRDADGRQNGIPLLLQRQVSSPKGVLQAVIGQQSQGDTAFSVGPQDAGTPPKFQAKFTVLDNGLVGIGTTAPDQLLTLYGSGETYLNVKANNGANEVLLGADAAGGILSTKTNHDLQLRSGGNITRMVIKADGKVGIGTLAPGYQLDVADRIRIRQGTHGTAGTWLFQSGSNSDRAFVGMADDNHVGFWGSVMNNWGLTMDVNNGNVGIGTTNPKYTLDIQGDFGRDNGPTTAHLWGSRIGDVGGGVLFLRSGGGVIACDEADDKVGIGLNNPACKLHVANSINGSATNVNVHVAIIENTDPGPDADVLALKVGVAAPGVGNNYITFFGGNTAIARIEGNGVGGGVSLLSGGADFAECLPRIRSDETIKAGDVVGIFSGRISKITHGADHVSAITSKPVVVGNLPSKEQEPLFGQVALLGQVGVKVRGPVQSGDFIIPSGLNDGVGRAVSPALLHSVDDMQIIGQAWEASDLQAEKIINVAIGLSSNNANLALASQVNAQQREIEALRAELKNLMALIAGGNPDDPT